MNLSRVNPENDLKSLSSLSNSGLMYPGFWFVDIINRLCNCKKYLSMD